ncbi:hypothetical protein ACFSBZ_09830 [Amnibacterium flavum]|uniref:Uncharacterized protein n=1 Tax=Amnibacterium flavum TaxID=2173173 RepID=A0A2V1HTY9_9MICO|nr:hypothetical protein [Amnibacterium flavum]PVZ95152.1 hypothetical protein DDQ50_01060 [Amnibacterium flavum]
MSILRPYRLERELDSAFYHWLAWLPQWTPATTRRRGNICAQCPRFVDALGLDEIPHGPLHGLFGAVETLLAQQFDREVSAQFPALRARGEWVVGVEAGVVRVFTSQGESLDTVLERAEHGGHGLLQPVPTWVNPEEAADARIALIRSYWSLFEAAVARLGVHKSLILRAIDAHVEPKVRRLADELVAEVCGAA